MSYHSIIIKKIKLIISHLTFIYSIAGYGQGEPRGSFGSLDKGNQEALLGVWTRGTERLFWGFGQGEPRGSFGGMEKGVWIRGSERLFRGFGQRDPRGSVGGLDMGNRKARFSRDVSPLTGPHIHDVLWWVKPSPGQYGFERHLRWYSSRLP